MQLKVKGIVSYPHLHTARAVNPGDDPKYSVSVLLRKDDPQLVPVRAAIEQDKLNTWPSGFPDKGKVFLKDGAVEYPSDPKMHNYMIISTSTGADSKPSVVDSNLQPVLDPGQACAGTIAWVAFNTFTYNQAVNKGVSAGLNAVMTTGEIGELGRLDGRPTVDALFGDIVGGSAAAPAPSAAPAPAPSAPAPAPTPQRVMTAKAQYTYEQYKASNWSDAQLVAEGLMQPPVPTSF